ncbi:hypothetical protein ACHAXN_002097, partial [Cyclotella atomus]
MKQSILADPCCAQYDPKKRFYLKTDFAQVGMGYVGCQPDSHPLSIAAMEREMAGGACEFLTNAKDVGAPPRLRPISMGSRRNKGYKLRLHSHLGEAFALDWAINCSRLYCWGFRFTNIGDCYSLKFIMTYKGVNPVILRVQMRLSLWPVDIVHRTCDFNVDSDYMSKLATDTRFDPLLAKYLTSASEIRHKYPSPNGEMLPEHMPGYRKRRSDTSAAKREHDILPGVRIDGVPYNGVEDDEDDPADTELGYVRQLTSLVHSSREVDADSFSIYPIRYKSRVEGPVPVFVSTCSMTRASCEADNDALQGSRSDQQSIRQSLCDTNTDPAGPHRPTPTNELPPLANGDIPLATRQLSTYQAAIYGFGGGHLYHSLKNNSFPIQVVAAADLDAAGRSLLQELMHIPRIFSTARALYDWMSSDDQIYLDLYLAHAPVNISAEFLHCWWFYQAKIIKQARISKSLQAFMIIIPSVLHVEEVSDRFGTSLHRDGWVLTANRLDFANCGDSIDDYCTAITGVRKSTASVVEPIAVISPPTAWPNPIASYIYDKYNDQCYSLSFAREYIEQYSARTILIYDLVPTDEVGSPTVGCGVFDTNHLFPPIAISTGGTFGRLFGVEFEALGIRLVRSISPYEVVRGFGFDDTTAQTLSLQNNIHLLAASVPTNTSRALLDCLTSRLRDIRDASVVVDESSPFAAPAATAQVLLNGASTHTLPNEEIWRRMYAADPETKLIMSMITNPSLINKENFKKISFIYRPYLRQGQMAITDNGMLVIYEQLQGSDDMVELQVVPKPLQNIVFCAFHANPIGGHFNSFRTFHRIRLRFFWPRMFTYIEKLCKQCAGCRLANPGINKSSELVYNFPVTEPMAVVHLDAYSAGSLKTYDGVSSYLVAACNMTTFGNMEGIEHADSTSFAAALMKMQLRYGFFRTIVLDKDSKFYSTFKETATLLKMDTHTLSRVNPNAMLVERLNRYFNKILKIFNTEHGGDPCVAHEGLAMGLYAWNCGPVPGTDISRCLMVTGREWRFPIDFCKNKHLELLSRPRHVHSFGRRQAEILSSCRKIGKCVVDETRAIHRELINDLRPDPKIFEPGDYVFARRTVQSNKGRGVVGKLEFAYTGPWEVIRRLKGASYECRHTISGKIDKFIAAHLSPVPKEIIPFAPVDGCDSRFGQLNKPLSNEAYKQAGIEGFLPHQPAISPGRHVFSDSDLPPPADADATTH